MSHEDADDEPQPLASSRRTRPHATINAASSTSFAPATTAVEPLATAVTTIERREDAAATVSAECLRRKRAPSA